MKVILCQQILGKIPKNIKAEFKLKMDIDKGNKTIGRIIIIMGNKKVHLEDPNQVPT